MRLFRRRRELPPPPFDSLDPAFVADPYPTFRRLRDEEPLHRLESGPWVLTRYEDVMAALQDPRFGNAPSRFGVIHARNRSRYACADVANNILPFQDAPEHDAPRRMIGRAFFEQLRTHPPDYTGIAEELLERLAGRSSWDGVGDFASAYSLAVIGEMLGIPRGEQSRLKELTDGFFYLFVPIPDEPTRVRLDDALTQFRNYLAALVAERRRSPGQDLISRMLGIAELDEAVLIDTCMLLFADGVENVDSGIGNALSLLLSHRDQLERVLASSELWGTAVEECLRYESPGQFIGRVAREPIEMHGQNIAKDAPVLLVLGSANRDERKFPDPDRFDVGRDPNPHLAFGHGRHACLGGPLVKAETVAALQAVFARYPRLQRASSESAWGVRPGHRWVTSLPVVSS